MKIIDSIDRDYILKLEQMNISINRKMGMGYNGIRKSEYKGNSMEFSDFRQYSFGDDIKNIDWNSYARLDKPFLKLFMEEKQANINIFIDTSSSMDYGKNNKAYYSKMLAASIAYISLKNLDKVNIFPFGSYIYDKKLNICSKNMFFDVLNYLDNLKIEGESKFESFINKNIIKNIGKGLSIIISDFFCENGFEESIRILQNLKQDIIVIQLMADEEINPNLEGSVCLIDNENGNKKNFVVDNNLLINYKNSLKLFKSKLNNYCRNRGIIYYFISTDNNIIKALNKIIT